jgi:hypothetical protein
MWNCPVKGENQEPVDHQHLFTAGCDGGCDDPPVKLKRRIQ